MKKALLFLSQGVEEYEASVFADSFGWTTTYGITPIKLVSIGLRPKIKCAWNFTIEPECQLNDIDADEYDALIIPGGLSRAGFYDDTYDERLLSLIRFFDKQKKLIASVCVGALPIAKSGVLTGRNGTTYQLSEKRKLQMKEYGVNVLEQRIVIDENIITSQNPATAMDVAFILIEKLTSKENVERIKEGMGFTPHHRDQ